MVDWTDSRLLKRCVNVSGGTTGNVISPVTAVHSTIPVQGKKKTALAGGWGTPQCCVGEGDAAEARRLAGERPQLIGCCLCGVLIPGRDPDNGLGVQSTSVQMESIWRMQVVRENATKRDIWKRCSTLLDIWISPQCCSTVDKANTEFVAAHRKVEQVSEETDHLRMALDKCNTRERRCLWQLPSMCISCSLQL